MSVTLVSGRLKPTIRSVRQAVEARERYALMTIEDSMMPMLVRAVAIPGDDLPLIVPRVDVDTIVAPVICDARLDSARTSPFKGVGDASTCL
jgi:hypothetical protein